MDKLPKPLLPKLWLFMLSLIGVLALGSGLGERWRGVSPRAAGAVVAVVVGRPDGQV
jgi:hypothetical protein